MEYQNKGYDDDDHSLLYLPPGFRFHPTDEEIITNYLKEKVMKHSFTSTAIGDADFNKCEPWDLPKKAKMGEKEWYFFCQRDRKYPTGMRTNRATESGYWKATGKDKEIYSKSAKTSYLVGMKKTLVFYMGRAPKGEKTNWVMHEYRLDGHFSYHNLPMSAKDEWVVSRVFHKSTGLMKKMSTVVPSAIYTTDQKNDDQLSFDFHSSLPPLVEVPQQAASFVDYYENQFKTNNNNSSNPMFNPQFSLKKNNLNSSPYLYQQNSSAHLQQLQCKIEQYSCNQFSTMAVSHASQDTGLSTTDAHTDISSSLDIVDDHGPLLAHMPDFSSLLWDDY